MLNFLTNPQFFQGNHQVQDPRLVIYKVTLENHDQDLDLIPEIDIPVKANQAQEIDFHITVVVL